MTLISRKYVNITYEHIRERTLSRQGVVKRCLRLWHDLTRTGKLWLGPTSSFLQFPSMSVSHLWTPLPGLPHTFHLQLGPRPLFWSTSTFKCGGKAFLLWYLRRGKGSWNACQADVYFIVVLPRLKVVITVSQWFFHVVKLLRSFFCLLGCTGTWRSR